MDTRSNTASLWRYLILIVFLGAFLVQFTGAIHCFQCAETQKDAKCFNDYDAFFNTSRDFQLARDGNKTYEESKAKYSKNCSASNRRWDRCVIETHQVPGGAFTLFRRDCHDGEYFQKDVDDFEFHNLTSNNQSTCAYVKTKLICFTFCNEDLCNGPQYEYVCEDYYKLGNNITIPKDLVCAGNSLYDSNVTKLVSLSLMTFIVAWYLRR